MNEIADFWIMTRAAVWEVDVHTQETNLEGGAVGKMSPRVPQQNTVP
jgi:hypothetical protein